MIEMTIDYWDCECDVNYIHAKSTACCLVCGACSDEQPDSRIEEVNNDTKERRQSVDKNSV